MKKHFLMFVVVMCTISFSGIKVSAEEIDEDDWARKSIDLQSEIDKNITGKGVKIGFVDTGVDKEHEALKGKIAGGYACLESEMDEEKDKVICKNSDK